MKNQIFELFGFPVDNKSEVAERHRRNCICPFYNRTCDGGGNRYQSFVSSQKASAEGLDRYFDINLKDYPPGVCSLTVKDQNWIVCPRRLFSFGNQNSSGEHFEFINKVIYDYCEINPRSKFAVWGEVKIKYNEDSNGFEKSFDSTFDYLAAEVGPRLLKSVAKELKMPEKSLFNKCTKEGIVLSNRDGENYIEYYPLGNLHIIEVMTSSTSGGNKKKGNTIQQSFIDAIKGNDHESPSINYRQVWARMVSQLVVKSQIGKEWGSNTLWILQDVLTDYISKSTSLNLNKLISDIPKGVNMVSVKYSDDTDQNGCLKLEQSNLFSGEVPFSESDTDFNRLLQASVVPKQSYVKNKVAIKRPIVII
jgi:hypothetical protein